MAAEDKPPVWYWIAVCVFALLAAGSTYLLITTVAMDPAQYQAQTGLTHPRGPVYWAAFCLGVIAEDVGIVALALRRSWAVPALAISLIATIGFDAYILFGMSGSMVEAVTITAPHLLGWLFAVFAARRGWLLRRGVLPS